MERSPAAEIARVKMAVVAIFAALSGSAFSQVAAPVFNPAAGKAAVGFNVAVTSATSGATIRYTTNGAPPGLTDSLVPGGHLVYIPRSLTLKACAWSGGVASAVTTSEYQVVGDIAAGGFHALAVKSNRAAYSWGHQESGDSTLGKGTGTAFDRLAPDLVRKSASIDMLDAIDVAAGRRHGLALLQSGNILAFGANSSAQLGNNSTSVPSNFYPAFVLRSTTAGDYLSNCVRVSAADTYSAALGEDSYVYTWGGDNYGRLGRIVSGTDNRYARVVKKATTGSTLGNIQQIATGKYHMLARSAHYSESSGSGGNVWVWGLNSSGQLGLGSTTNYDRAIQTTLLSDISDISAGDEHTAVVKHASNVDGYVYCFGQREFGRLGNNSASAGVVNSPITVKRTAGGTVLDKIVSVSAGPRHTLALDRDRKVWAWGRNARGELGDGSTNDRAYAQKVRNKNDDGDLENIVAISAGGVDSAGFNFAVAADGTIYAWGANDYGQLGIDENTVTTRKLPKSVGTLKLTNTAPVIELSMTRPVDYEPVTIALNAAVTDVDGGHDIEKVDFYEGSNLLGTDSTAAPYSYSWGNKAAGSYTVTAIAKDLSETQSSDSMTFAVRSYVSVLATATTVTEDGLSNGAFRISRLTTNSNPLVVSFTLGGTAVNGKDYKDAALSAMIPANQSYVDVTITGEVDYLYEPTPETVVLTLLDNGAHFPNPASKSATAFITDVTVYDGDGLSAGQELALGTSPVLDDTDGDKVNDNLDAFPLDPTRWDALSGTAGDVTAPTVVIQAPASATQIAGP